MDSGHDSDRLTANSLPGCFSVRGDWFLATAKGSRSWRLADEALDLLSSRRANYDRLQYGIGLPTRDILPEALEEESVVNIRTALTVNRKSSRDTSLTYQGLKRLGARTHSEDEFGGDFDWLWRSQIDQYDRDRGIWLKWLWRTMNRMLGLKREQGGQWASGFEVYDKLWFRDDLQRIDVINSETYIEFTALLQFLEKLLPDEI